MTPEAPSLTAKQEQGVRSREEILDAAERLMGAHGYAATSISTLSRESGLPASSIYWHFGSKSGVLGAVMERGSSRFFAGTDVSRIMAQEHPRDRLAALLEQATEAIHAHPQFLRLFLVLLLGSEGDHAQNDIVARVRAEGAQRLRHGLQGAYAPWGDAVAERIGVELCALALAFFDGLFIAGQVAGRSDAVQVDQAVTALHALAERVRGRRLTPPMFADVVKLLAAMLATGWLVLAGFALGDRRRRRRGRAALLLTVGTAVLLFGLQAVLADHIADAGGGATPLDAAVSAFTTGHRTPALTALAETLNVAGSLAALTVLAVVVAVALLLRRRRIEAVLVLSAPAAAGLLGPGTKLGYDRARPPVSEHLVAVSDSSLPSGHTLDATIVLGVLAVVAVALLRSRRARAAVVVAACAGIAVAGAARVYLGVHWATDVLAGWLLGGAWVGFSAAALMVLAGRYDGHRAGPTGRRLDPRGALGAR